MKTEMCSPATKTEHSVQKLCHSVNDSWGSRKVKGNRSGQFTTSSKKDFMIQTGKHKSKSQILLSTKHLSKEKVTTSSRKHLNISHSGDKKKMKKLKEA